MIRIEDLNYESEDEIQKRYDDWLKQGRTKIIEVNDRIIKFQEKAEKSDGSKKKKYQFLVKINQLHLSEMISALKNEDFFLEDMESEFSYRDLFPARTPFGIWSLEFDDLDWRCKINFLKMPISKYEEMEGLYNSTNDDDKQKYLVKFKRYIKEYEICEDIRELIERIYVLKDRKDVINDAIELYERGRYLSFINLAAIQIEGLFNDYLKELEIEKDLQSIIQKVELLRKKDYIWGYTYYAFEFPDVRNKIAHGNILDRNLEEKAMELLTDIYNILSSIFEADSLSNRIITFLKDFSNLRDKNWTFVNQWLKIEGELCRENKTYKYGNLFNRLLKGEFQDRVKWEGLTEQFSEFQKLFEKEEFWNKLLIEEYDDYMGILKEFFSTNKKYIPSNYYDRFNCYEKKAKGRVRQCFGKDDWEKFYFPHYEM